MDANFKIYQKLMPYRVRRILIVSSPYDAYIMEDDGGLMEQVATTYRGFGTIYPPSFTVVSSGIDALTILKNQSFDLVITMPRFLGMDVITLAKEIKSIDPHLPVVLLSHSAIGLEQYLTKIPRGSIDKLFVWSGNRDTMLAILKWAEDRKNVDHDTQLAMVRVIIVVEDSPFYYSSILPIIYQAIFQQTQELLQDTLNEEHRLVKIRTRPKILLATTYEEGMELFEKYRPYILGIFSDVRYPKNGKVDAEAGLKFFQEAKSKVTSLPCLLMSSEHSNKTKADEIQARFQDKNSPTLHVDIRRFILSHMGFGDFVFRMPDGKEVARVSNLASLEGALYSVPDESLSYHSSEHHFTSWLMARSEIALASRFKDVKKEDFETVDELRRYLIKWVHQKRMDRQRGIVVSFDAAGGGFYSGAQFIKVGDGSLGGKARGLAFMSKQFHQKANIFEKFKDVNIRIPNTMVLTTDSFDDFISYNQLEEFIQMDSPNDVVARVFSEARIPPELERKLQKFLNHVGGPLAVRSSSLLEDSKFQPYAGIYSTYMLPNNHQEAFIRVQELKLAVKLVYASIFYEGPRAYSRTTHHRVEEEKMAVIIQEITGKSQGRYFYPSFSGTAQSYNFYPLSHQNSEDGIANIGIGLGKIVVEGGQILRFSPPYPQLIPEFSSVDNILKLSQQYFFSLDLENHSLDSFKAGDDAFIVKRDIYDAIEEFPVRALSSSYFAQDHRIRDVNPREGDGSMPVVTFASVLKYNRMPLAEILQEILPIARDGFGSEVELEFAVNLASNSNEKHEFVLLQARPMTTHVGNLDLVISKEEKAEAIAYSSNALGVPNDEIQFQDIIYVKPDKINSSTTVEIAKQVSIFNEELLELDRKYILVGPGRWGSSDRCLGAPVGWKDISGVGAIIEAATDDFRVDPSQGTHFFQNITSLGVIYFTVYGKEDFFRWDWPVAQEIVKETEFLYWIRVPQGIEFKIEGKSNKGVLLAKK